VTVLFNPVARHRLERAFGNYPDIIRAWEQLQAIVGGTAVNSIGAAVAALATQVDSAEIASFLQAKTALEQANQYSDDIHQDNDVTAQISQLRAEVGQLREMIAALQERP
jgi:hypothetical protein